MSTFDKHPSLLHQVGLSLSDLVEKYLTRMDCVCVYKTLQLNALKIENISKNLALNLSLRPVSLNFLQLGAYSYSEGS